MSSAFHGRTLRRQSVGSLVVTHSAYRPAEAIERHAHARASFVFVARGEFTETTDAGACLCRPSTVIYRPAGAPHRNRFGGEGGECIGLELDDELPFSEPAVLVSAAFGREFASLREELACDGPETALLAHGAVAIALARLSGTRRRGPAPRKWLERVRDKLVDEFRANHSLAELAAIANVHPVHVSREFHRFFGCSIAEYVRAIRIGYVQRLLAGTALPIAQIASDAGFADQAHLTRVFKRGTGTTPSRFRARTA